MNYNKLYENWNRHVKEDDSFDERFRKIMIEHIENKSKKANKARLNEMSVSASAEDGIHLQTDFMKWATYAGMTSTVVGGAVTIAAMYAPWTSFLILMVPAAAAMMSSPIAMAIAGFLIFRFSWTRKLAKNIIGWLGGDGMKATIKAAEEAVQKMIDSSNGELDKKSAWELFKLLATTVINNKEFRSKLSEFKEAIKGKNEEVIAKINDEMDALVEKIVQQDILNSDEENEEEADIDIDVDGEQEIEEAHPMGNPEAGCDIEDKKNIMAILSGVRTRFDHDVAGKVALQYLSDLRNGTDGFIKQHELCKAVECSVGIYAAKQLFTDGPLDTSVTAEQKTNYNKLCENWNRYLKEDDSEESEWQEIDRLVRSYAKIMAGIAYATEQVKDGGNEFKDTVDSYEWDKLQILPDIRKALAARNTLSDKFGNKEAESYAHKRALEMGLDMSASGHEADAESHIH